MSDSLQFHATCQTSLSLVSTGACSNSCPLSQRCHPTISSSVTPFSCCPHPFPASGAFPESALCIRWPKYWSFSFSINTCNEYPGLISFGINWLALLAVQGILKSSPAPQSVLRFSAFFMVQLSYLYMTLDNQSFDYMNIYLYRILK